METDRLVAIRIVKEGIQVLQEYKDQKAWEFGRHWVFSLDEHRELESTCQSIVEYVGAPVDVGKHVKPLGIAVFGPPGSGKSTAVRNLFEVANRDLKSMDFKDINLTQVNGLDGLLGQLQEFVATSIASGKIPFIFVDEFDCSKSGVPLGWLSTFLVPLEDAKIGGTPILCKLVLVFAGGTAHRMEDFGAINTNAFRNAKGPDFASRLGGYVNVRGPNETARRDLRRAVTIRSTMEERYQDYAMSELFTESLLNEGRFRHGARSLVTLTSLSANHAEKRKSKTIELDDIPGEQILSLHADQGPLDPDAIGGLIGISVGREVQEDSKGSEICVIIAQSLWQHGAALGYGGKFDRNLSAALLNLSRSLSRPTTTVQERIEVFQRVDNNDGTVVDDEKDGVRVTRIGLLGVPDNNISQKLRNSISAFRMRWLLSSRSVAQIFMGGKLEGFSGRIPGILEECVLALALRRPIYLVGALGGMSSVIGEMLGFGNNSALHPPTPNIADDLGEEIQTQRGQFQPHGFGSLPIDFNESISFVMAHAFGGPNWQDNGLNIRENRELLNQKDPEKIATLLLKGLRATAKGFR